MPKLGSAPSQRLEKPNALELFTDRTSEQEVLRRVLAPKPITEIEGGWTNLLTVFWGVGGVGKSTLCRRAMQIAREELRPAVTCAYANLDYGDWHERVGFTALAGHLCEVLVREAKLLPRMTCTLLAMMGVSEKGGADERWQMVLEAMDKGVEMAGVPGLSLLLRGANQLREWSQKKALRQRMTDLDLWPDDEAGARHLELESRLPLALHHDIMDALAADENLHLRLLIDGFERIQGKTSDNSAQKLLQEFVGHLPDREAVAARFRVLIFGREKVDWDGLYQDPSRNDFWNQHLLGGLSRSDAILFLSRRCSWHHEHRQESLAELLQRREADILDASDELQAGQTLHYPYFLELAVEMVEGDAGNGGRVELGRTPKELQDRLLCYLEPREKRALQILALAGTFDSVLFDWLAERRLVAYERHCFLSTVHRGQCYFVAIDGKPNQWRFHRHMQEALLQQWRLNEQTRSEAGSYVGELLDFHAAAIGQKELKDWTDADLEHWRCGMEILVGQGLENGPLSVEDFMQVWERMPWCAEHYLLNVDRTYALERAIQYAAKSLGHEQPAVLQLRREYGMVKSNNGEYPTAAKVLVEVLEASERILGADHPDTLKSASLLGGVLSAKGDLVAAEALYRRTLEARERLLGSDSVDAILSVTRLGTLLKEKGDLVAAESLYRRALETIERGTLGVLHHPGTIWCVENLGSVLLAKGDLVAAEALYRRALEWRECCCSLDHPGTLACVENLGSVLLAKGDLAAAEALYRRVLDVRERVLGVDHPATLACVNSVGDLLSNKGDLVAAEVLYRRALGARERVLGVDHPDTLASVNSLGILLKEKGDLVAAEALYRRAVDARERTLGPDHHDTAKSRERLSSCREAMAKTGRANDGTPSVDPAL